MFSLKWLNALKRKRGKITAGDRDLKLRARRSGGFCYFYRHGT
jgi:hypothetical protein